MSDADIAADKAFKFCDKIAAERAAALEEPKTS